MRPGGDRLKGGENHLLHSGSTEGNFRAREKKAQIQK